MYRSPRFPSPFIALATGALLVAGCMVEARHVEVHEVDPPVETVQLTVPVKAHLANGDVVLFRNGAMVTPDSVLGTGIRYALVLRDSTPTIGVPLDSIAALESFTGGRYGGESAALSAGGTVAAIGVGAAATGLLMVALFGSCPTVYAPSQGAEALQAELFSYSIAPLFEMRDVDGLRTDPSPGGSVTLTIRNEALETHYLNHLEILEVELEPDQSIFPDIRGRPVVTAAALRPPIRAVVRSERDVATELSRVDGIELRSTTERIEAALEGDFRDTLELVFPAPGTDSVALVVQVRNSLLNTVLFYDVMLGAGSRSVQWLGGDMDRIGPAASMGRWYSDVMGIRVSVLRDHAWVPVGRIPDVGPIAWKQVAVPFETTPGKQVRVRLEYLVDGYRLDAVELASAARAVTPRTIPVHSVEGPNGASRPDLVDRLRDPDGAYLVTGPGDRFRVRFEAGPSDARRGLLLASQGYYTEWVRAEWIRDPRSPGPFQPGDAAIQAAYRRWLAVRHEFEQDFERYRIPSP
jgi:hypothetical protein